MKKIFALVATVIISISCKSQTNENFMTIQALEFATKIKEFPKAPLIDVRTPEEFSSEHIDNALNINWNSDDFVTKTQKLDKSKPVFVYCKVGGRSAKASQKLHELGFTTIYNLDGGINKWKSDIFSVTK